MELNVKPVAQPIWTTPFSLRSKMEEKIQELINLNITQPANGPPRGLSPYLWFPSQMETFVAAWTREGRARQYWERDTLFQQLMKSCRVRMVAKYSVSLIWGGAAINCNRHLAREKSRLWHTVDCSDITDWCSQLTQTLNATSRQHPDCTHRNIRAGKHLRWHNSAWQRPSWTCKLNDTHQTQKYPQKYFQATVQQQKKDKLSTHSTQPHTQV